MEWNAARVAERLVVDFRELPNTPVYSARKGVFEPSRPIDGLDLITAVQLCLGREPPAAQRLLEWARLKATGESMRAVCHEYRQNKRSTYYSRRRRALEQVAAFLNERRSGRRAWAGTWARRRGHLKQ